MNRLIDSPPRSTASCRGATLDVQRSEPRRTGMPLRALGSFATTMSEMLGPRETAIGILTYRRIIEPIAGIAPPADNISPARLRQQLEGLLGRGFQAWPLSKVVSYLRDNQPITGKAFAITFNDPFENIYLNAFPILRELDLPATVFVAPAYVDAQEPLPCDRWEPAALGSVPFTTWKPLTTEECREMQRSGLVELGLRANAGEGAAVLVEAMRMLGERFGTRPVSIAFACDREGDEGAQDLAAAAQAAGAQCGLTSEPRLVRPGDSPLALGRFAAEEEDTAASLAAKLSGWYEAVHSLGRTILWRGPSRPPRQVANVELERN